jgi:hypothetical protein
MTFRGLTELQEQSPNAAHTRAITHRVETNGWNQLHDGRRWMTTDGSRPEMDHGMIWIATGYGWMTVVDDRRGITADESRETDDNQSPSHS